VVLMMADGIGASTADAGHHTGVQAATTASTARSMQKAEITMLYDFPRRKMASGWGLARHGGCRRAAAAPQLLGMTQI